ncbi:unnamed protein product [Protopolystoma xenopodis]|uniref:Uncharacterized protein n=1 Tax=Protopolystoma xenopodis TaxID=117903 RepID=A0A3S5FEM5_9PLAT|nr:unnamed protein product [Protopolystoma xenopodis]
MGRGREGILPRKEQSVPSFLVVVIIKKKTFLALSHEAVVQDCTPQELSNYKTVNCEDVMQKWICLFTAALNSPFVEAELHFRALRLIRL